LTVPGKGIGGASDGGFGVLWARAGVAATVRASAKATAAGLASLRAAPVCVVREGRDEQRMNAISKWSAGSAKTIGPIDAADLPPVLPKRQLPMTAGRGQLAGIVVLLPQAPRHGRRCRLELPSQAEAC